VLIRKLTDPDLESLWALRLRGLRENPEAFGSTLAETLERGPESLRDRLTDTTGDFAYFGAFDPGLVGMIGFHRESRTKTRHKGTLISFFVAPEARNRGIGMQLVQALIAEARRLPGLEVMLLAVVSSGYDAKHIYLGNGFEVYGTEPRALKSGDRYWDEDLMALRLHQ
jgi:ribosomal protein S18 acetylase RimI-like enzyme